MKTKVLGTEAHVEHPQRMVLISVHQQLLDYTTQEPLQD